MKGINQKRISLFLVFISVLFFQTKIVESQDAKIAGHFLVGEVVVSLGDGLESFFTLHGQRHKANPIDQRQSDNWSNDALLLDDGRVASEVFTDMKAKWQTFYQDMVNHGMPVDEMRQMLSGIKSEHERAGVWVLTGLNANGYTSASHEISIGPNTRLSTIAHESMHGWHWGACEDPKSDVDGILFQDLFTTWANFVYHTRKKNPEKLKGEINGEPWVLYYLNYGLQNDAEWLANTFAGWLYAPDKEAYVAHFDSIIKTIAPDLPGSPAEHYSLGYGDANHDGTTDWIATYTGPGPSGLGNGKYLWNGENKVGTYTFIVSGKKNDTYAEYKQDPYSTLPSMNHGALAQPWYREWQGEYGSCNGASLFSYRSEAWIAEYLKDIVNTINSPF